MLKGHNCTLKQARERQFKGGDARYRPETLPGRVKRVNKKKKKSKQEQKGWVQKRNDESQTVEPTI